MIASCGESEVRLWHVILGKCVHLLEGHVENVCCIDFSFDSRLVASGSVDKTIRIWSTSLGECIRVLHGHEGGVYVVTFLSNSTQLVSGCSDGTLRLWNVESGECINIFEGHANKITSIAVSQDSQLIASGSRDGTLRVWNPVSGDAFKLLHESENEVLYLKFSSNNELISTTDNGEMRRWDMTSRTYTVMVENYDEEIASYDLSSNLAYCALKHHNAQQVEIRNVEKNTNIRILWRSFGEVWSLAFSHDFTLFASGHEDGTVILWHLNLSKSVDTVESICLSPNAKFIAMASAEGLSPVMSIWSAESGRRLYTMEETVPYRTLISFSPNSELVAAVGFFETPIHVWKVNSGICIRKISIPAHKFATFSAPAISIDGSRVAVMMMEKAVSIWCIKSGECLWWTERPPHLHSSPLAFSQDLQLLAIKFDRTVLQVLHIESGQWMQKLYEKRDRSLQAAQFSHDASIISAVASDDSLLVWRIGSGECIYDGKTTALFVPRSLEPSASQILVEAGILTRNGTPCSSSSLQRFVSSEWGCIYGYGISRDPKWVTWNGNKFFLLPAQARPASFEVSQSTVLIETEARSWVLLRFHGNIDAWERKLEGPGPAENGTKAISPD